MGKIKPTNQNRQFYVATAVGEVSESAATGVIAVGSVGSGEGKQIFFKVKGADTVLRSDLIPLKNLDYAKAISAESMRQPLKKVTVTLDSTINSGAPISGQDYCLKIVFSQFFGGGADSQYIKEAAVHATASMTASNFYEAMKNALNTAFSRELGGTKTSNPYLTFSSSAAGLVIEEKEQDWKLGLTSQERVQFEVFPTTVYDGSSDVIWGVATEEASSTTIKNGKATADLEWFCAGEKGDIYRNVGWPNVIPTKYLVDPSKEYDYIELHYAFTDTGVNSYRSEKDITIVAETGVIDDIVSAINTAAGSTIIAPLTAAEPEPEPEP